jgi:hypothetical protein
MRHPAARWSPEQIARNPNSYTGQYLKPVLARKAAREADGSRLRLSASLMERLVGHPAFLKAARNILTSQPFDIGSGGARVKRAL